MSHLRLSHYSNQSFLGPPYSRQLSPMASKTALQKSERTMNPVPCVQVEPIYFSTCKKAADTQTRQNEEKRERLNVHQNLLVLKCICV